MYSRFWAQERKREPIAGPGQLHPGELAASGLDGRHDQGHGARPGDLAFWYVRQIDPRAIMLTGLTRDGLWWVEKGQVRYPVRNLRFNQSVLAMLAPWNVEAIGAPVRRSPLMVPALKLAAFTFTSISDAI